MAGGSGVVPLLAMVRAHAASASTVPMRLLYSVRSPDNVLYASELADAAAHDSLDPTLSYSRHAPPGHDRPAARISRKLFEHATLAPTEAPAVFVCGPNGFVATAGELLIELGHNPAAIKTERFGG